MTDPRPRFMDRGPPVEILVPPVSVRTVKGSKGRTAKATVGSSAGHGAGGLAQLWDLTAAAPRRVAGPSLRELDDAADAMAALVATQLGRVAGFAARNLGGVTVTAAGLSTFQNVPGPGTPRQAAVSADDLGVIRDAWTVVADDVLVPKIAADYLAGAKGQHDRLAAALPPAVRGLAGRPLLDSPALLHAAGAANRLKGIGDELWQAARTALLEGMSKGESIAKLARRVRDATGVSIGRATTIARTESMAARSAGSYEEMLASGVVVSKTWQATGDLRTRPTHVVADGQTVPMAGKFTVGGWPADRPHDSLLPPEESVNCVVGATRVGFELARAVMRRWYEGEVVTIRYASGDHLTVTPNHPVLRADGRWVPAYLINEGDHCIRAIASRKLVTQPDEYGRPSQISKVYRAARQSTMPERVALTPPDLHGDGDNGKIEIVSVHGKLAFHGELASEEQVQHLGFAFADLARSGFSGVDGGQYPARLATAESNLRLAPTYIGSRSKIPSLGFGEPNHPETVSLRAGSWNQTEASEPARDRWSARAQIGGHGEDALASLISVTKVVQVDKHPFAGHVYNLDTGSGWYSANSIIVRNCRCTLTYGVDTDVATAVNASGADDDDETGFGLWIFHLPGKHDQSTHGRGGALTGNKALAAPPKNLAEMGGDSRSEALWYRAGDNSLDTPDHEPGYVAMNDRLRHGTNLDDRIGEGFDADMDRKIADIDSVMAESKLPHSITVYRGLDTSSFGASGSLKGTTFKDRAFVSTTTNRDSARAYGARMKITVPRGTRAIRMADRDPGLIEREILLDRNLTFRIKDERFRRDDRGRIRDRELDVEII